MLKNKKSLVIGALVRIIIAVAILLLIIFPACSRIRGFFTGVSLESYENLLKNMDEISKADSGDATTQLLELNSGTAVLVFIHGTDKVVIHQTAGAETTITFSKPDECRDANSCVCMCKEIEYKSGEDVSCVSDNSCQSFNFPVTGICKIDGPYNYKWECTQGVVIERGLKENKDAYLFLGSTAGAEANEIVNKRSAVIVRIENANDVVAVCENPDTTNGCVPAP